MEKIFIGSVKLPHLGEVWLAATDKGLLRLNFPSTRQQFISYINSAYVYELIEDQATLAKISTQLQEYISGERTEFNLQIDWAGMGEFQRKALEATIRIPYGQTATYKQIAEQAGNPNGARAAGRAEATNPIPLVIPCHRVVGSDGKLHGYGAGAGLETKTWLLGHEKQVKGKQ